MWKLVAKDPAKTGHFLLFPPPMPTELDCTEVEAIALSAKPKRRKSQSRQPKKMAQPKRPLTNADAGRLVRKTAQFIEDNYWGRNSLSSPRFGKEAQYCIAGALNRVYCGNAQLDRTRVEQIPLLRLTYNLLDEFLEAPIERWNDVIAPNKLEVIQKLHKFADEHDPQRI